MRYLNGHGKCDLMEFNGNSYVVLVDYYSDFFEVDRLNNKTADEVVRKIKAHLARHGIPDKMITDNGPPFNSYKFREFAQSWQFEHITSSPLYPQSNGKAENAVKQAKKLDEKNTTKQIRSIPCATGNKGHSFRNFSKSKVV